MENNPFKENTTSFNDFMILSDLEWHCTKCELKSGQAKTWQVWRHQGIQLDSDEKGNLYKIMVCAKCHNKTVHRKLKSLKILEDTKVRSGLPTKLTQRIKTVLKFEEALYLRRMKSRLLEVDHKFPQIRWDKNEETYKNITDEEIIQKFILLTRSNNLFKSRHCEKCLKTGIRGNFPGIYYWYKGNKYWDKKVGIHNENGCKGCFWYDPYEWRKEINKIVFGK